MTSRSKEEVMDKEEITEVIDKIKKSFDLKRYAHIHLFPLHVELEDGRFQYLKKIKKSKNPNSPLKCHF